MPRTIADALGDDDAATYVRLLHAIVDVITTGLGTPAWEPTSGSEAADELRSSSASTDASGQPWGETPLRTVWAFAKMNCDAIVDFCAGVADTLGPPARVWSPTVIARAATEAASQVWWIMEAGIDGHTRAVRLYLAHRRSADHLARAAQELGVTDPLSNYGSDTHQLDSDAVALGIPTAIAQGRGPLQSESQVLPNYTERARAFLAAAGVPGAYRVHSASSHVELFALLGGYVPTPEAAGSVVVWQRYADRQVARGVVFVCAAAAIYPALRLAEYFGWTEFRQRLDDLIDLVDETFSDHK